MKYYHKNYRRDIDEFIIDETDQFEKITIFIGANGSGKSTFIKEMKAHSIKEESYEPYDVVLEHHRKCEKIEKNFYEMYSTADKKTKKLIESCFQRIMNADIFFIKCLDGSRILSAHMVDKTSENGGGDFVQYELFSNGQKYALKLVYEFCCKRDFPIFVDNIESGLHFDLYWMLYDLIKHASERNHVFVSTYSPIIVDSFYRRDKNQKYFYVCENHGSYLEAKPLDVQSDMIDDDRLGSLWCTGYFGGTRF